jgi:hypothetical protein
VLVNQTWLCEGCGDELPKTNRYELRTLQVVITRPNGRPVRSGSYELCPACQVRLIQTCNLRLRMERS